jgi:hypothetical protein
LTVLWKWLIFSNYINKDSQFLVKENPAQIYLRKKAIFVCRIRHSWTHEAFWFHLFFVFLNFLCVAVIPCKIPPWKVICSHQELQTYPTAYQHWFNLFMYLFIFVYSYVHTLSHFSPLSPTPSLSHPPSSSPLLPPWFQAETILPLSLILLKREYKQ